MGAIFCHPSERSYNINGKRYTCSRLLGEGGFSFVYLVKDSSGKKYALKSMLCQTPESLNVANKEVNLLRQLNHPNIIKVIDSDTINSVQLDYAKEVLILLPFCKEGTLQDVLDKQRTVNGKSCMISVFTQAEIINIFQQLCQAVLVLHSLQPTPLAHRDLKPGNILLEGENNKPILLDFGSVSEARINVETRKRALEVQEDAEQHSTPMYRAPELFDVATNCTIDERTDVWALGCILYAMAFNKSPFEADESSSVALKVVSGQIEIPPNHKYSQPFIQLIHKMLSHSISNRPFINQILIDLSSIN
ncbi:putative protein serine/threonine kinase [Cavenderia fasciculata]|uniref:Protein kinase domain-containing protein n=1 Tax=Cavenderia fasciculata TaxID=261658 RepID=F4PRZ4_CACFS|nr:putative protein serine/threonine kinase [Cavenderia fasciculata]EGG20592.1 putative protein serine/threonine kinase [Cavenderia fasciculata]|eukprot:XP_004358442.1 putative protein serine/threonine kinase [Cavenderia fasciculata]